MSTETFAPGDLVEARYGATVIRGSVIEMQGAYALSVPEISWAAGEARELSKLRKDGWTLALVKRARVYEPGVYLPAESWAERYAETGYLSNLWVYAKGEWWSIPNVWGTPPRRLDVSREDVSEAVRLEVSR